MIARRHDRRRQPIRGRGDPPTAEDPLPKTSLRAPKAPTVPRERPAIRGLDVAGRVQGPEAQAFLRVEFTALHNDIDRRSNAQQTLMALYVTGVGVTATVAVRGGSGILALLVLPFIGWAIATLYVDHHVAIVQAGKYIDETCRRRLGMAHNWESWSRANAARPRFRLVDWRTGPYLVFLVTGVVAVLVTSYFVRPGVDLDSTVGLWAARVAWGAGVGCVVMTCLVLAEMRRRLPDDR